MMMMMMTTLYSMQGRMVIVRFPDPPYGVGREKEPPRSWEKNFEATKLRSFQWRSPKLGAFWNSAHVRRPLTLVSLTQLHWLPCKNQFYPTSSLQLGPPPVCNIGFVTFHHLDLRPEAFSYFLPRISNNICDFTAGSNSEKAVRAIAIIWQ